MTQVVGGRGGGRGGEVSVACQAADEPAEGEEDAADGRDTEARRVRGAKRTDRSVCATWKNGHGMDSAALTTSPAPRIASSS